MYKDTHFMPSTCKFDLLQLQPIFGDRLKEKVPLARYTTARVGGLADVLISVNSQDDLLYVVNRLWNLEVPFLIIGGGSNMLISDAGVRELVVYNRARHVNFDESSDEPSVRAESGASLGLIARQAAAKGLAGLEWAAGIPGTIGGAVVGNAGAHGSDMAGSLSMAEILHQHQHSVKTLGDKQSLIEEWPVHKFEFGYRDSILKRQKDKFVVLSAVINLVRSTSEEVQTKIQEFVAMRQRTQPPGASIGSMFKNPPGDFAGRLIEAAGLKGAKVGGAEISSKHANFFINRGDATAVDVKRLIDLARSEVSERFGVGLELEIELVGEW
jgi:UDP-N-acetylmuramate dehydrogenase